MIAAITHPERRYTDRGGNGHGLALEVERTRLDRRAQFFKLLQARLRRCTRDQQDKFLATKTRNKISWTQVLAQLGGNDLEYLVACQMTVAIIDALEVIEVEHGNQQWVAVGLPLFDFILQTFSPGRPVR